MLNLLWLDLKRSILLLSGFKHCSESEDELSEVSPMNKMFKMLLVGTTLNSGVPPTVVVGTILLRSKMGWIIQEWLRLHHLGLALDGAKDLVDRKLPPRKPSMASVASMHTLIKQHVYTHIYI